MWRGRPRPRLPTVLGATPPHHPQPGATKPSRAGPTTAATFSSASKSETSPAPTATCSRISTGSIQLVRRQTGSDRAMEQRLHRAGRALCRRRRQGPRLRAPRHRSPDVLREQALRHRCTASADGPAPTPTFRRAAHSSKVAFVYSSLGKPEEIYLADSADKLDQARAITSFNKLSPSAIFRKASPTRGRPTTAPPSKAC